MTVQSPFKFNSSGVVIVGEFISFFQQVSWTFLPRLVKWKSSAQVDKEMHAIACQSGLIIMRFFIWFNNLIWENLGWNSSSPVSRRSIFSNPAGDRSCRLLTFVIYKKRKKTWNFWLRS